MSNQYPFPGQFQSKFTVSQVLKEQPQIDNSSALLFPERLSSTTLHFPRGSTDELFYYGNPEEMFPVGSFTSMKEEISIIPSNSNLNMKHTYKIEEKSQQSISKNNIRNFLTPVVRMRDGFFFNELIQQEKITRQQYESFLRQHFHIKGKSKLRIRQATFDSLFEFKSEEQLQERRILALTLIKCIQNQFLKLILEKAKILNLQELKQQFEWINGINHTLIEFLNYLETNTPQIDNLS